MHGEEGAVFESDKLVQAIEFSSNLEEIEFIGDCSTYVSQELAIIPKMSNECIVTD